MIEKFSIIEDFSNTVLLVEVKVIGDDLTFVYADGREFKFPLDVITNGLVKFVNDKAPDENGRVVINIDDISELRDFITSTTAELFRIDFEFSKHKNDTHNPHNVTAEQVDTYTKVVIDDKDTAIMNKANSLENANMFKDVSYNNVNGILIFTRYDDTTKQIDLPLELLVESGYYDEVTNELVLVLANGSEIRIPVGNLLTDLDAHNIRFNGSGTN